MQYQENRKYIRIFPNVRHIKVFIVVFSSQQSTRTTCRTADVRTTKEQNCHNVAISNKNQVKVTYTAKKDILGDET